MTPATLAPGFPAASEGRRPGVFQSDGLTIHYQDTASFFTAYKDIFDQRIYEFDAGRPDPYIIDGGASIGVSTLYFKSRFPQARIVCFEPDRTALTHLGQNITANRLSGVEVVRAGLAGDRGESLFLPDGADGGRILDSALDTQQGENASPVMKVPTVRLSDHVTCPVDLLKLNIEGFEWPVLRELEASGRLHHVRRMIVEYHGWPRGPQALGDILQLLSRNGFRYLVHDFDRTTNPASKPPFRLRDHVPWFCLIYAGQMGGGTAPFCEPLLTRQSGGPTPVSRVFGLDRGTPIDRHYIESFLERHRGDIRGSVLEVGDATYTTRFGGDAVTQSHVLHAVEGNRRATIVGDLASGRGIPSDAFDCIVLTQTLGCIYDVRAAVGTSFRALRRGGVVLATVPGISQISRYDMDRWGDFWRFTTLSARRLFEESFAPEVVQVAAFGNVSAAAAFLQGRSLEEMDRRDLDFVDPDYELLIAIRAVKSGA